MVERLEERAAAEGLRLCGQTMPKERIGVTASGEQGTMNAKP
jgi:hypothetical protein